MGSNPKLFREMSEPHESSDAATAASEAFFDDLRRIRTKHRVMNLVVVSEMNYLAGDGEESTAMGIHTTGDRTRAQVLCAYAVGALKTEFEDMMGRFISGKK